MKKRLLSLLLILCLCAALLPAMVLAEDNVTIVKTKDQLEKAITEGGAIQLGEKIELTSALDIKNTVILDLNGYKITRAESTGSATGSINAVNIKDGGHLTLTDSSNGIGAISDFDGSVHVLAGGTFTMNGGRLLAGRALGGDIRARGGGVLVDKDGLFVMNGGSIESCLANGDGGGVYVNGMFRMTGGTIYNCGTEEASYDGTNGDGGGVFIAPNGRFEMSGGSIENCKAIGAFHEGKGGGVYVGGTFNMTGGTIKNCTAVGKGDSIYVADGAKAALVRGNIEGEITGNWTEYIPPVDPIDPDYPLISILPALTKDLPFADVTSTDWFYNDVKYAYETGLMTGTASDAFSPEAPATRAHLAAILHRYFG